MGANPLAVHALHGDGALPLAGIGVGAQPGQARREAVQIVGAEVLPLGISPADGMSEVGGIGEDGGDVLGALMGAGVLGGEAGGSSDAFGAAQCDADRNVVRAEARARPVAGSVSNFVLVRPALPGADEVLCRADIAGGSCGGGRVQGPVDAQRIRVSEGLGEVLAQVRRRVRL